MAESTAIEWCDSTFNPWIGCTRVSPACDNCYAARSTPARTLGVAWGAGQPRQRTSDSNWELPKRWQRQAAAFHAQCGRRRRVFCASLADVFDNEVPQLWRTSLFALIHDTPDLDWLLLTKRIGNAARMLQTDAPEGIRMDKIANLWIGATVCNQAEVDRDVPKLLEVPAHVRFLSVEPMLGPVDLQWIDDGAAHREVPRECWGIVDDDHSPPGLWWNALTGERTIMHGGSDVEWSRHDAGLDWVICGGESGPRARPMHPEWTRSLRDQCAAARVPFMFKQWGEWIPADQSAAARAANGYAPIREFEHLEGHRMHRIGKKGAGRMLDGRMHDEFPA